MRRLTATDLAARPLMQLPHKANSGSAWDASGGEGRVLFTKQFGPGQRDKRLLFPATAMQQLGVTRTVVSDGPTRSPDVCRAVHFSFPRFKRTTAFARILPGVPCRHKVLLHSWHPDSSRRLQLLTAPLKEAPQFADPDAPSPERSGQ